MPSNYGQDGSAKLSAKNRPSDNSHASPTYQKQLKLSDKFEWLGESSTNIAAGNTIKFMSPKDAGTLSPTYISDLNTNIYPAINKYQDQIQQEKVKLLASEVVQQTAVGNLTLVTKLPYKAYIFYRYLRGIAYHNKNDIDKFPEEFTNIEVDKKFLCTLGISHSKQCKKYQF